MTITVKLGGALRQRVSGHQAGEVRLSLAEGARVSEALASLGLKLEDVRVMMVDGRPIKDDQALKENDRLALFGPELAFNNYVAINFFNNLLKARR